MKLDRRVCARARLARDARFDGKFFIAVKSTRVYCRPICPARTCKESNVRYYPTAAAAAEAGFRPCLRCRPECSPGTPAWLGTPSTVSRGLRLIAENGLTDGGVEDLAEKLGIGTRHLRRLFLKHLGATPSAVAQTQRLHFAKKLIDDTNLPMGDVALASGFGCVRRFNAAISKTYHRTPTQIRHLAQPAKATSQDHYVFRLRYRPPFHWKALLAFLAPRATPGVEHVGDGKYSRSISLDGNAGWFEVAHDEPNHSLMVRLHFPNPRALFAIVQSIRKMFDLNADWPTIGRTLNKDAVLAELIAAAPGLRVPGSWNGFELATRAILGQQVTVKGATTLAGRLAQRFGRTISGNGTSHLFPAPEVVAGAKLESVGLPRARAESIRALARAVSDGTVRFDGVADSSEFVGNLCKLPGIGPWTAQYVAMRAIGEPDAFPSGDLGLLRALGMRSSRELEERSQLWRPWRAYAAMHLWNAHA
jgi:AraC family transcriptional regulator, regulatory protein of adaptative response / DNA-3-methyladenine glycosylase II